MYRTIEITEDDYQYLEKSAKVARTTIQSLLRELIGKSRAADKRISDETPTSGQRHRKKSRWAQFSERICEDPPLSGAGDYVRECGREFREDFTFRHDEE